MDLKSVLKKEIQKAAVKTVADKILPMDDAPKPRVGPKAKIAGALALIGTLATLLSQYLGG
jgi:hypothetical protein